MILSISRRTDIPAFYSDWFINRLIEGYAYYQNPYDKLKLYKVDLTKEKIDLIVFWTKNPQNIIDKLDFFKGYNYYFQFTLTSYNSQVEKNLPKKNELIKTFIKLSNKIGKNKIIWRYDPIFINDYYTKEYHYYYFDKLCSKLAEHSNYVTISFLDYYKNTESNCKNLNIKILNIKEKEEIALKLKEIAYKFNLSLKICSQNISEKIEKASCIDKDLIKSIFNFSVHLPTDKNQRKGCSCLKSIDLGVYSSCANFCIYCYANSNEYSVQKNMKNYDKNSPLLLGKVEDYHKIVPLNLKSNKVLTLF